MPGESTVAESAPQGPTGEGSYRKGPLGGPEGSLISPREPPSILQGRAP